MKYEKGGKPRNPDPLQEVFYSPPASDEYPLRSANAYKGNAMSTRYFKRFALGAVGDEARGLLGDVITKW